MQKVTLKMLMLCLLIGCSLQESNKGKILFVVSNQHTYGNTTINASNHFAEIVWAYDVFARNGYSVDFVSPEGGAIPIGYLTTSDALQKQYLYNSDFMNLLKQTYSPQEIDASDYRAIYYSGGGAAMFGVAENMAIQQIATEIYENDGVVSSVCHGTAGIVNLKNAEGQALYQSKRISGYPDLFENMGAQYYQSFPFSIEQTIGANGGNFVFSTKARDNFVVVDGRFITGQDPSATASVAQKVVDALEKKY